MCSRESLSALGGFIVLSGGFVGRAHCLLWGGFVVLSREGLLSSLGRVCCPL